jgi:hypothetical protein
MPVKVNLEHEMPELKAAMAKAGKGWSKLARNIVDGGVEYAVDQLQYEIAADRLVNEGHLIGNIQTSIGLQGDAVEGFVWPAQPYAPTMDEGRRPGTWPRIDPLTLWVRRKFGIVAEKARSVAWAVATVIKRKGIKGRHYMRRVAASVAKQMPKITMHQIDRFLETH